RRSAAAQAESHQAGGAEDGKRTGGGDDAEVEVVDGRVGDRPTTSESRSGSHRQREARDGLARRRAEAGEGRCSLRIPLVGSAVGKRHREDDVDAVEVDVGSEE
ncbi:MAG: hypothetical protein ACK559_01285, partial [bacterium]